MQVGQHRDALVFVLQQAEVTVEQSGYARCVRHYGGNLGQVKLVETDGYVLQHVGILVFRRHLYTRTFVGHEVHLGLYTPVATEEYVVVFIEIELGVAQYRMVRLQVDSHTTVNHLRFRAERHAQLVVSVEIAQRHGGTLVDYFTVEQGCKHKLRVAVVVAHLAVEAERRGVLLHAEGHGVDASAVDYERMDKAFAVETVGWRGRKVHVHIVKHDAFHAQEVGQRIVVAARETHLCRGQQCLELGLVYHLVTVVSLKFLQQVLSLAHQPLIATLRFKVKLQTSARHLGPCGVASGVDVHGERLRAECPLLCCHGEVVHQALQLVLLLQVGGEIKA